MPDRNASPYIVWFDDYREDDYSRVGGKNASLGELMKAGLPVPPGFAVTTDAYETLRSHLDLTSAVRKRMGEVDLDDAVGLAEASREVRRMIEHVPLPDDLAKTIAENYETLCEFCDMDDVPVAVRSSATAEDLPDASFAGEMDSFLWVQGIDGVLEYVKKCWSSIFTDRAVSYRAVTHHDHEVISMSVGIQKMVQPKAAGVAFTLNPVDGDRSQIAIDAAWGFGEAVVGGEVTPDNYLVDKVLFEITKRKVSEKTHEYVLGSNGKVELVPVDKERRTRPCLTDDELKAVAAAAKKAERHYGCPQDVEWAIDMHLPEGENVVMLQSRPETVWSRKPRKKVASDKDGSPLQSIVHTLVAPVHTRKKASTVDERVEEPTT